MYQQLRKAFQSGHGAGTGFCLKSASILILAAAFGFTEVPQLRVCADPNNLPFSNQQEQGFENALTLMIAQDLGMQVSYTWFLQRGSFFGKTVGAGQCDVVVRSRLLPEHFQVLNPQLTDSWCRKAINIRHIGVWTSFNFAHSALCFLSGPFHRAAGKPRLPAPRQLHVRSLAAGKQGPLRNDFPLKVFRI
jgi:hypothetical protein